MADDDLEKQGFKDQWTGAEFQGPDYDINDTRSINTLLGYTRKRTANTEFYDHNKPKVLGHVSPNREK